jgi:outer membrane protein OmpA-like peptidoglycan-associated protein
VRRNLIRTIISTILLSGAAFQVPAEAMDMNEFYRQFLDLVRESKSDRAEQLVMKHRTLAASCLEAVQARIDSGKEPENLKGFRMLAEELEELIAVTGVKADCPLAEIIYERAMKSLSADDREIKLRRAVRLCPKHVAALTDLARHEQTSGRFEDAVTRYREVIDLQKGAPEALLGLAETYYAAGLYLRCLPYLTASMAAYPEDTRARKLNEVVERLLAREKKGIILSEEVVDLLRRGADDNLMCMCPQQVKLLGRVSLLEVAFRSGSCDLNSRATAQLVELAAALKSEVLRSGHYLIEGHADRTGTAEFNQALSLKRASVVRDYLVKNHDIDSDSLSVVGMGSSRNRTEDETSAARRENRRIEIVSLDKATRTTQHAGAGGEARK